MIELAREEGHFGLIRIMERKADGARLYCLGDGVHTMARADGLSLFGYVHALKKLSRECRRVLLIGGAGGSLATMMARRGHAVTVMDIDLAARPLAERFFGLDPRVEWITADAVSAVHDLEERFDAVIVDACDTLGTAPAFANAAWLAAAMDRVAPDGQLLLNLATAGESWAGGMSLARTVAQAGFHAALFYPSDGEEGNELLRISRVSRVAALDLDDVQERPTTTLAYLTSLCSVQALPRRARRV